MTLLFSQNVGWQDQRSCKGAMKLMHMDFTFPLQEGCIEQHKTVVMLAVLATKRCLNPAVHDWADVVSEGKLTVPAPAGKHGELIGDLTIHIQPTEQSSGKLRQNKGRASYRRPHFVLASPGLYTMTIYSAHHVSELVRPVVSLHTNYHGRLLEPLEGVERYPQVWDLDADRRVTINGIRIRGGHKQKRNALVGNQSKMERKIERPERTCVKSRARRGSRHDWWMDWWMEGKLREKKSSSDEATPPPASAEKAAAQDKFRPKSPATGGEIFESKSCSGFLESKMSGECLESKTNSEFLEPTLSSPPNSPRETSSPPPCMQTGSDSDSDITFELAFDSRAQRHYTTPFRAVLPGALEVEIRSTEADIARSPSPVRSPSMAPTLRRTDSVTRSTSGNSFTELPALALSNGYSSDSSSVISLGVDAFGESLNRASSGDSYPSQWLTFSSQAGILAPPKNGS
eukprot:gb/GEZN01004604.1/.p1 GENE.gb/GEZN01004604.1/~~gb/GEZN01004604.1/.p1  ORF type:complete len:466 (+),score=34.18 gb/GEZN01004604.1/:25-1398(+)